VMVADQPSFTRETSSDLAIRAMARFGSSSPRHARDPRPGDLPHSGKLGTLVRRSSGWVRRGVLFFGLRCTWAASWSALTRVEAVVRLSLRRRGFRDGRDRNLMAQGCAGRRLETRPGPYGSLSDREPRGISPSRSR